MVCSFYYFISHRTYEVTTIISTLLMSKFSLRDLITSLVVKGQRSVNKFLLEAQSCFSDIMLTFISMCLFTFKANKFFLGSTIGAMMLQTIKSLSY